MYGYTRTRLLSFCSPLFLGCPLLTAGIVGLSATQPASSTNTVIFSGLAGIRFGGPLVLIVAGVQLSTPRYLIATSTTLTTCSRALAAAVSTAIFSAAAADRLTKFIPSYIATAATQAGSAEHVNTGFCGSSRRKRYRRTSQYSWRYASSH